MYEADPLPADGDVVPPGESRAVTLADPLPVTVWVAFVTGINNACMAHASDAERVSESELLVEVTGVEPIQSQHKNANPVPATGV